MANIPEAQAKSQAILCFKPLLNSPQVRKLYIIEAPLCTPKIRDGVETPDGIIFWDDLPEEDDLYSDSFFEELETELLAFETKLRAQGWPSDIPCRQLHLVWLLEAEDKGLTLDEYMEQFPWIPPNLLPLTEDQINYVRRELLKLTPREEKDRSAYLERRLRKSRYWRDLTAGQMRNYLYLRKHKEKSKDVPTYYTRTGQNQIVADLVEFIDEKIQTTTGEERTMWERMGKSDKTVERNIRELRRRQIISLADRGSKGVRVSKWRVRLSEKEIRRDQINAAKKTKAIQSNPNPDRTTPRSTHN